jgi:hypothetical protein
MAIMRLPRVSVVAITMLCMAGCANVSQREAEISPEMNKQTVTAIMGLPMTRSVDETKEAWQYGHMVGFGQCAYTTVWFSGGKVVGMTSRRGPSVAGCGLGSHPVDWNQMPH